MTKKAFTLIEVLITIAIISLMATLLIPNINRSLTKNNIANDAQLLQAKLEQTRLLAGSTQQFDEGKGYYGLYFPYGTDGKTVYILRIQEEDKCTPIMLANQNDFLTNQKNCIVEEIRLSSGVTHSTNNFVLILFKAPTQQLYGSIYEGGRGISIVPPLTTIPFPVQWDDFSNLVLNNGEKTATLSVNKVTGKLTYKFN